MSSRNKKERKNLLCKVKFTLLPSKFFPAKLSLFYEKVKTKFATAHYNGTRKEEDHVDALFWRTKNSSQKSPPMESES
jgi:hypothetical protein